MRIIVLRSQPHLDGVLCDDVDGSKGFVFSHYSCVVEGLCLMVDESVGLLRQRRLSTTVSRPEAFGVVPRPICHIDKCSAVHGGPLFGSESFDAMWHRRSYGLGLISRLPVTQTISLDLVQQSLPLRTLL